ncbi:hypothetical protein K438DRAFT_1780211 [Mycena galopus ATCC 62051]|nr:hypothetical protein K438DRAFT_1780211 [Mycena galopus ATCC 62051]
MITGFSCLGSSHDSLRRHPIPLNKDDLRQAPEIEGSAFQSSLFRASRTTSRPYRRDNIEKVRRDEEEGRQDETKEEGRMLLADSEARIDLLRERAGVKGLSTVSKSKRRKEDDDLAQLTAAPAAGGSMQPATDWQINFFEDLEHPSRWRSGRGRRRSLLGPSAASRSRPPPKTSGHGTPNRARRSQTRRKPTRKRKRDAAENSVRDPFPSITHQLAALHASTSTSTVYKLKSTYPPRRPSNANANAQTNTNTAQLPEVQTRPARAMKLIRRKQREIRGSETPSSVHGGGGGGYGDMFNRREVEEAHCGQERRYPRRGSARGEASMSGRGRGARDRSPPTNLKSSRIVVWSGSHIRNVNGTERRVSPICWQHNAKQRAPKGLREVKVNQSLCCDRGLDRVTAGSVSNHFVSLPDFHPEFWLPLNADL